MHGERGARSESSTFARGACEDALLAPPVPPPTQANRGEHVDNIESTTQLADMYCQVRVRTSLWQMAFMLMPR